MKTKVIFILLMIIAITGYSQDYSTQVEVLSSGFAKSTNGMPCYSNGSTCNFGLIGEPIVSSDIHGGNYEGYIGFIFSADPENCIFPGKEEVEFNFNVEAYPVPVKDILNIQFSGFETSEVGIEVRNILGQSVYEQEIKPNGDIRLEIDLSIQPPGMYLINCKAAGQIFQRKIIKD